MGNSSHRNNLAGADRQANHPLLRESSVHPPYCLQSSTMECIRHLGTMAMAVTVQPRLMLFCSPASGAGLAMWTNQPECFLGSVCLELKDTSALCSLSLCHTTVNTLFLPGNLGCCCVQDPSPDVLPASTPLCQSTYSKRK